MLKINLDKRICDCEDATNTETYREFMIEGIHEIYGYNAIIPNFDEMCDEELNDMLDDIDYLLDK